MNIQLITWNVTHFREIFVELFYPTRTTFNPSNTDELGYDKLNGIRIIGLSYAKSVINI